MNPPGGVDKSKNLAVFKIEHDLVVSVFLE
jgi:hypothetical protein